MILQFGFFFGGGGDGDDDDGPELPASSCSSRCVVYVVSFFLMQALSRYREFAADRGAAVAHRPPERAGLGAAEDQRRDGAHPAAATCARASELNAFFISRRRRSSRSLGLFATHPPMEKRIERLQRLEAQLQGTLAAA